MRYARESFIAAKRSEQILSPFCYRGTCNTELFNMWLKDFLIPVLNPGQVVIMDNAAFHKSVKTRELIESFGCYLLFLPTYSPDLNPIEHWWHKIKSILRPLIQKTYDNLHNLLDQCLSTI